MRPTPARSGPSPDKRPDLLFDRFLVNLPELQQFPTIEARDRALRLLKLDDDTRSIRNPGFVVRLVLFCTTTISSFALFEFVLLPRWIEFLVVAAVNVPIGLWMAGLLDRDYMARNIRRALVENGIPVCLNCGYPLKGLPAETRCCPECGRTIEGTILPLIHRPIDPSTEPDGAENRPTDQPDGADNRPPDPETLHL